MLVHPLRAAQATGIFERIIVSTDSDEIAAIAREHGADVPFMRPAGLADDFAGTDEVICHALEWFAGQGIDVRYFCCIYPTAPFIRPADIREGLARLQAEGAATAFSVTTFPYTIFRSLKVNERGRVEMFWPENFPKRSQDFPTAYHDAGQFYWGNPTKYLQEKKLFSSNSIPIPIPRKFVQDIDTPEDWEVAEHMFRVLRATEHGVTTAHVKNGA